MICIEILSPEDRISRAKLVLADYYPMGVANIWLLDPMERCAYVYDGEDLRECTGDELMVADGIIRLNYRSLFAHLDSENT